MGRTLRLVPAVMMAFAVVACGGADETGPEAFESEGKRPGSEGAGAGGVTLGPDGMPVGPDGKPLSPKLDGKYELSNYFDVTSAGVFPDTANDTLKALSNFREKPTQTMVDLLDAANVPVVPNVLNAIPAIIRDQVLGWVDENIIKSIYKTAPFAKTMTGVLDDLASITTKFELVTTLDVPTGNAIGDALGSHTFSGVAWNWQEKRNFIGAPEVLKQLELQQVAVNAVALEKRSPELESGRLKIGKHKFDVPIGSFMILAMNKLLKDKFGVANLREALGAIVNCEAIADTVSKKCIDPIGPGKVCVDHKNELKGLCNAGLEVVTGVVQGQISRLDLPLLDMREGQAQMWDAAAEKGPLDATIDRIDKGFWEAHVTVGKSDKKILATFVGKRIGDTASPSR
ncbi:MAG: hypothetical protein JST00_15225 [Deltaproteobacteria bacterium]|nr:hypothetical protein [Deltaproteobacteria bacterium]